MTSHFWPKSRKKPCHHIISKKPIKVSFLRNYFGFGRLTFAGEKIIHWKIPNQLNKPVVRKVPGGEWVLGCAAIAGG